MALPHRLSAHPPLLPSARPRTRARETAREPYFQHIAHLATLFPEYDLTLTGYSFGAAVISIAAFDVAMHLRHLFPPARVNVVTVGGTRAGNRAFAAYMNAAGFKRLLRLVHSLDPIPHIPKRGRWCACVCVRVCRVNAYVSLPAHPLSLVPRSHTMHTHA